MKLRSVALNHSIYETALCGFVTIPDGKVPEWIELLPPGKKIVGRDGREFFNDEPEKLIEAFRKSGMPAPLDYEHATEIKGPAGEPAPAAGWITAMEVREGGSIWGKVEWNAAGSESVNKKEYRYISPVLAHIKGVVKQILSAGLTNQPNLHLTALNRVGEEQEALKQLRAVEAAKAKHSQEITMKKLLALLGLKEDATEDQICEVVSKMQGEKEKVVAELATARSQQPSLDQFVPRADYEVACNKAKDLEKRITEEAKASLEKEISVEIDSALAAGKITPATVEYHKSSCSQEGGLQRFKDFIKAAPVVGAPSGLGDKGKPAGGSEPQVTEDILAIATNCGLSKEQYMEALKAQ